MGSSNIRENRGNSRQEIQQNRNFPIWQHPSHIKNNYKTHKNSSTNNYDDACIKEVYTYCPRNRKANNINASSFVDSQL